MKKEDRYATSMEGFTEDFNQRIDKLQNDMIEETTSYPLARRHSEDALKGVNSSLKIQAQSYARNEMVNRTYQNVDDSLSMMSQNMSYNYSPDKHVKNLAEMQNVFTKTNGLWTPEQSRKGIDDTRKKFWNSFETYHTTNPSHVQEGIDIIEGRSPQSKALLNGMDTKTVNNTLEPTHSASE